MHGYISRLAEKTLARRINNSPVVAILGPRQCGKSTLAREFLKNHRHVYLDLQDRADMNKLREPELFFEKHREELVCLDEIQLIPNLFNQLRSEVDRYRKPGRFLILGSASRDLIRQSNETLAGRIAYLNLHPFVLPEVTNMFDMDQLWLRGGFPESVFAETDLDSFDWRFDFIRTFLERDIPSFGYSIPTSVMERLWRLLSHYHGQVVNYAKIAAAADLSVPTLKKYLGILEQAYMIRTILPFEKNMKKRLIKAPKLYIRDTGILHCLLDIENFDDLLAHPINGASWEGFAIENIINYTTRWQPSYLRTSNNAEIDLVLTKALKCQVFEFKLSKAPKPSRGFFELINQIKPDKAWIVAPVDEEYEYKPNIWVIPLERILGNL